MIEMQSRPGTIRAAVGYKRLEAGHPPELKIPSPPDTVNTAIAAAIREAENALHSLRECPNPGAIPRGFVRYIAATCTARELREARHACELEAYAADFLDEPDAGRWKEDATFWWLALQFREELDAAAARKRWRGRPGRRIDFDRIKAETDIVAEICKRVKLRRQGRSWVGLCPFHDDRDRPNLVVWTDPPVFKCFRCDAKGDVFTWWKLTGEDWRLPATGYGRSESTRGRFSLVSMVSVRRGHRGLKKSVKSPAVPVHANRPQGVPLPPLQRPLGVPASCYLKAREVSA